MKAKYTGHDEDGAPRRVGFAGKSFPKGVFVDVSDVRDTLKAKLVANPYFETSDEPLTAGELAAAEEVNGSAEDGGEPGAAAPAGDKAAVIAALEAIQAKHPE